MEHSTRKAKIIACVLVAFSIIYLLGCLNTSVGKIGNPGAGLIPWLIAVFLFICTGLNAFRTFKRRDDTSEPQPGPPAGSCSAVIGIAIVILLYPLLLYTLKAILARLYRLSPCCGDALQKHTEMRGHIAGRQCVGLCHFRMDVGRDVPEWTDRAIDVAPSLNQRR